MHLTALVSALQQILEVLLGFFIDTGKVCLVEGLAYARFRKDTLATGSKDETGMKCIYGWFFAKQESVISDVEAAFSKYADHIPAVIAATMLKKECGE